jgi:glycyl-tRNA synthetase beta chain
VNATLLVELFTEELPPKALRQLGETFGHRLQDGLIRAQLKDRVTGDTRIFATPRRLAVSIPRVHAKAADRTESKKLMPSKVAFGADGKPSAALAKRLEKDGATADQIERRVEDDAEYAFLEQTIPGMTLAAGLQLALQEAIVKLPIPKVMSYQLADGATTVQFVRPAHGLVALHGGDIVDVSVLGLKAGRITHGHRFQGVPDIPVAAADAYEEALAAHGRVIASFDGRRAETERQLRAASAQLGASLGPEYDVAPLLEEVTALVEYPSVYIGEFEPEFLVVPQECLVLTMRTNQKYFPLFDAAGKLINRFLIVSNMRLADPKNIVDGNNRVVRPRLADARFFFETDKKNRLEARVPQLGSIVYHNKLGTLLERVERVQLLAGKIARKIGADPALAERAAWLAKADLLSNMVGEFPELQGVMGHYYALADGEDPRVAEAVEQHYRPRFAGDALPANGISVAVALADKMETLIGMFGAGQKPTGDKDPFALRRHALGIVRILAEKKLPIELDTLLQESQSVFAPGQLTAARADKGISVPLNVDVIDFIHERARSYLRDQGYSASEVESVLSLPSARPSEYLERLNAVRRFLSLTEATELAESDKRIRNIINKSGAASVIGLTDDKQLIETAEKKLLNSVRTLRPQVDALIHQGGFEQALLLTAHIHLPVKQFFDEVMVNVEDETIRNNRFALLHEVSNLTNRVANLSELVIKA